MYQVQVLTTEYIPKLARCRFDSTQFKQNILEVYHGKLNHSDNYKVDRIYRQRRTRSPNLSQR
ncbi:hypothetical protein, partial [Microcoleus sp. herbarium14]|uniref:hypothetical protein n=1 Tax=Microcoleus sp. herbarium14 TaxID=3055439 RepID=UPI002FCFF77A